jgi:hypothetical protein
MRRSEDYSRPRRRTLERIDRLQPRYFLPRAPSHFWCRNRLLLVFLKRFQQSLERRALTDLLGPENIRPMRKRKRIEAVEDLESRLPEVRAAHSDQFCAQSRCRLTPARRTKISRAGRRPSRPSRVVRDQPRPELREPSCSWADAIEPVSIDYLRKGRPRQRKLDWQIGGRKLCPGLCPNGCLPSTNTVTYRETRKETYQGSSG